MYRSIKALLLFSVVLTVCVVAMGLRAPGSGGRAYNQRIKVDETQFPIAEESSAPEPPNPEERAKKIKKEKKYSKYQDTLGDGNITYTVSYHWPPGFPMLPVGQNDAVVIGEVADAKAYVTSEKSTVYSEFTVRVLRVLKDDNQKPIPSKGSIVAERPGGRVRYASGYIGRFSVGNFGMPRAMGKYVLFLNRNAQEETYNLVTGYELRDGRVSPLDTINSDVVSYDEYQTYINMGERTFFEKLDAAIAMASAASANQQ